MATKDFEKLKDYTGIDFKVEQDGDEYTLSSGAYVDTGYADLHIPKNGNKPEKLVVYVGSDGLYRIFDLYRDERGNTDYACETNQCFLNDADFKEGHVTIVEYVEGNPDYGMKKLGDYYISLKTGDERATKPYGQDSKGKKAPEASEPTNG
ncbi:MAG: hypothetical protein IJZ77_01435 [Bacilli bacterium]|nr:hypothetical protein [Bacilli bacterium]MBQ8425309.1 hypothetical protein [Clostridia bacterium]